MPTNDSSLPIVTSMLQCALKWQLEVKSHLLACLIVQDNHPTINFSMPNNFHASSLFLPTCSSPLSCLNRALMWSFLTWSILLTPIFLHTLISAAWTLCFSLWFSTQDSAPYVKVGSIIALYSSIFALLLNFLLAKTWLLSAPAALRVAPDQFSPPTPQSILTHTTLGLKMSLTMRIAFTALRAVKAMTKVSNSHCQCHLES